MGVWLNTPWGKKINVNVTAAGKTIVYGSTYRVRSILKAHGLEWMGHQWEGALNPEEFKALLEDLTGAGVDTGPAAVYAEYLEVYHAWKQQAAQDLSRGQVSSEEELRAWLQEKAREAEK